MREVYLNFHGLGKPPARITSAEAPYWLSEKMFFEVLSLVRDVQSEKCNICFTFDDGNKSDVSIALPMLQDFYQRAWFFPSTDLLDKAHYLSHDDLGLLCKAGMIIGSHGTAHVRWTQLPENELQEQVSRSLHVLEKIVGNQIKAVAVPYGEYNHRVLAILKRQTLGTVFTSDQGSTRTNAWLKPRTTIRSDTSLAFIEALCTGHLPSKQRFKNFIRPWKHYLR